MIICYWS